ncbi:MAG: acyltransferase [bacterium]|nr:acyltransferase [bacterium]
MGWILDVPPLGPSTPSRGNWFSRTAGRFALRLIRWRFDGRIPDVRKAIIIVVPHTTNWDFYIGVSVMFALGLRVAFLGKHTIFRQPLSWVMRWMGGIPVNRRLPRGVVEQTVEAFERAEGMILALSPEGTRSKVPSWRTGFYRIAREAKVPIIPVAFDFGTRSVRIGTLVELSGDMETDLRRLGEFFVGVRGHRHELATLNAL